MEAAPKLECMLCGRASFVTMEDGLAAQKDPNYVKRCSCGGALITLAEEQEIAAMAYRVTSPARHEILGTSRELTVDELVEQRIASIMGGAARASQSPRRRGAAPASAGGAVSLLADALRNDDKRNAVARWIESLPVEHVQSLMEALSTPASVQIVSPPPVPLTGLADLFKSSPAAQSAGGGDSSPGASALQLRKQQRSVAKHQLFRAPTNGFGDSGSTSPGATAMQQREAERGAPLGFRNSGSSSPGATAMQRRKAERSAQRAAPLGFSNSGSSSPGATAMQRRKAERAVQRAAPLAPSGGAQWQPPPMAPHLTSSERRGVFDPLAHEGAFEPRAQPGVDAESTAAARCGALARNERVQPAHVEANSEYRSANSAVADIKAALGGCVAAGRPERPMERAPPRGSSFFATACLRVRFIAPPPPSPCLFFPPGFEGRRSTFKSLCHRCGESSSSPLRATRRCGDGPPRFPTPRHRRPRGRRR